MIRSLCLLLALLTDTTNPPPVPPAIPTAAEAPMPIRDLREVAPGILEYHGVRLDKKNHRISFPATVNQHEGLIEYLLVNDKGKTYESLFETKLAPHTIHLAMLLIGLKQDAEANAKATAPPPTLNPTYLQSEPKMNGPAVQLSVAWTQEGKRKEVPVEDWILNLETNHPMTNGPWTYNGSMIQDGVFLADQEFSIVSVVTDPTALVNNPRKGYDNNGIWQIRDDVVPPLDTPVEISITLTETSSPTPTKP